MNVLTVAIDIGGVWYITIFYGLVFCLLYHFKYLKKTSWPLFLLFSYVAIFALYIVEYPELRYGALNKAYEATAGKTLSEILLITLAITSIKEKKWFYRLISLTVLFEIISVWYCYKGLLRWASFDNALIALCLPFMHWTLILPSLITILSHHGATAILIAFVQLFIFIFRTRKYYLWFFTPLLPIAYYFKNELMLGSHSRIEAYQKYMDFFFYEPWRIPFVLEKKLNWSILPFGIGPGSFTWTGMMINNFQDPIFFHLHSDWLQILFETGFIAFFLCIIVSAQAIKRSWNNTRVLCGVFGSIVFAMTYHPFRFFPSALMIAFIFWEALRVELPKKKLIIN